MVYYGLYRGTVLDSNDPMGVGRVMVSVPALGLESWALVATPPAAGASAKFQIGATVILAFEGGDAARPVVLGQVGSAGGGAAQRK